jgi:predicted HTH transcriptional regulator
MRTEEIVNRIRHGEDSRTQFKREAIGIARLAEELTAFANADGGVILFGVDDDGTVAGLDEAQRAVINRDLSNAANDGVRPAVYPRTEFHDIDGKVVLAVIVPEGCAKPYADKSGAYWTKSGPDKRRIVAREELQRLLQKSLLVHADEMPVPNSTIEDVDMAHLGMFLERNYGIPRADIMPGGKSDVPQLLSNLGLMSGSQLTLAGLMLFGMEPQCRSPVNIVKAVWFKGNDSAVSEYFDSEDIGGSIRDMYKGTMSFLKRCLHHVQNGQGFNSLGVLEVPEEALQELVVNMFLHRDYFVSSPWRVFVFDDRIELISPGSLPNHLSIEQMKAGVSIPRNPLLFSLAVKDGIPYRGIGTGVRRAVALVPGMVFENDPEGFFVKVVIKLQSPRNRTDKSDIQTDNASGDGKNRTDGAKIRTVKSENRTEEVVQGNLPKAMRRLLSALRNDILLTSDLMGRLSIRSRGAFSATYVKPGLRHGLLEMLYPDSKRSKKQAYRLTEKGLALLRLQESGVNCV